MGIEVEHVRPDAEQVIREGSDTLHKREPNALRKGGEGSSETRENVRPDASHENEPEAPRVGGEKRGKMPHMTIRGIMKKRTHEIGENRRRGSPETMKTRREQDHKDLGRKSRRGR